MNAPNYSNELRAFSQDYRGPRERAVRHASDVFEFYTRVFVRARLNRQQQSVVNAVLAYFVVPDDLFPEEKLGPFGLVDDLYVAGYAFKLLRREVSYDELLSCWDGEAALEVVMDEIYRECRAEIGKKGKDALRLAGLS